MRYLFPVMAGLSFLFASCKSKPDAPAPKPNILLILTDDQGYPTLESYGGRLVRTPNLDRLAAEGARFTDAYATSQCTPTRASLLTGQYTARNGMWHVIGWYGYPWARMAEPAFVENLPGETFTLAQGLRNAGYTTGIMGKWHLTTNEDGHYIGLQPEAAGHYGFDIAAPLLDQSEFADGADRGVRTLTEQALSFIQANRERPWFCFLSHHMIHGNVVAPDSLVAKYHGLGYGDKGPNRAVYLSGLELIDWSVGRLMEGLEALGEADETMVVFLSDNGGIDERLDFREPEPGPDGPRFVPDMREYDNSPLRAGKGSIYEGGVRVPFIVRWPDHTEAGAVVRTPVHVVDLAPTLFEAAGAQAEHALDGVSLVQLLEGDETAAFANRAIYQYYPFYDLRWGLTPSASIRLGQYKLIEFFGDRVNANRRYVPGNHLALYDLLNDPAETTNLVEVHPQRTATLQGRLHTWIHAMGARIPASNPHFDSTRAFVETREKPSWMDVRGPGS